MKKLWLVLFLSNFAWAAYSPGGFIADPTTPTQRAAVSAGGALKVDNSGVTQPVSGTVTVTQGTGTNLHAVLDAGSAIAGKVGIDQTTPGTTNGVQVNAALPAGTNLLGKVGIDQTTPGTTNGVQINAALPAGTNTIGTVKTIAPIDSTAAFSQTSVTTTASTISAPANAVKVLIQGDSSNTDCIRWRFDGTAATATVGMVAQPGQDSGEMTTGMSVSVASCSGTQKVNVQYFAQ